MENKKAFEPPGAGGGTGKGGKKRIVGTGRTSRRTTITSRQRKGRTKG